MTLQLGKLKKGDYKKAIQFAITGMHFNWYMENKLLLQLYGRYFLYLELMRATQVIAVYQNDELAGVLLAEINAEPKKYHSLWKRFYVKLFDFLQNTFAKEGVKPYDQANKAMFDGYCKNHIPDGEIIFLAANPNIKGKGIGTMLLTELTRREHNKEIYLYTDNACTYQFYERRGFELAESRDVRLEIGNKNVPLKCLLYYKVLC